MRSIDDGLNETDKRVLVSIHLTGKTGPLGSIRLDDRVQLLTRLIVGGWMTNRMELTEKGIRESREGVLCR
jgi:hypothetical protein